MADELPTLSPSFPGVSDVPGVSDILTSTSFSTSTTPTPGLPGAIDTETLDPLTSTSTSVFVDEDLAQTSTRTSTTSSLLDDILTSTSVTPVVPTTTSTPPAVLPAVDTTTRRTSTTDAPVPGVGSKTLPGTPTGGTKWITRTDVAGLPYTTFNSASRAEYSQAAAQNPGGGGSVPHSSARSLRTNMVIVAGVALLVLALCG